jgi:hypothetical protein
MPGLSRLHPREKYLQMWRQGFGRVLAVPIMVGPVAPHSTSFDPNERFVILLYDGKF